MLDEAAVEVAVGLGDVVLVCMLDEAAVEVAVGLGDAVVIVVDGSTDEGSSDGTGVGEREILDVTKVAAGLVVRG